MQSRNSFKNKGRQICLNRLPLIFLETDRQTTTTNWNIYLLGPDHRVPPKPTRRLSPVCKSKEPLFLHKFANSVSQYWSDRSVPSSFWLDFYSTKRQGEGFLRPRTPDWLTFVWGCPCEKHWVCAVRGSYGWNVRISLDGLFLGGAWVVSVCALKLQTQVLP